jgi:uncharacterized membrane protein required for colicin V production
MNWLDIALVVILAWGAYYGYKKGLIGTGFLFLGIVAGVLLAGQFSDDVGNLLTDSISSDTLVTFISYAIIIVAAVIAARIAARIFRTIISMMFLGWTDKLGGLALGLLAAAALSGALITGMARLTYNFEMPSGDIPDAVMEQAFRTADAKEWTEDALIGSALVPTYIDITTALPASALGFVPSDFRVALDILEDRINNPVAE